MAGYAKNAVCVGNKYVHAGRLESVFLVFFWHEEILILQTGMQAVPCPENFHRIRKLNFVALVDEIVAEDQLECRISGNGDIVFTDLEDLFAVRDIRGTFLARAPLCERICGDCYRAAFLDYCDRCLALEWR